MGQHVQTHAFRTYMTKAVAMLLPSCVCIFPVNSRPNSTHKWQINPKEHFDDRRRQYDSIRDRHTANELASSYELRRDVNDSSITFVIVTPTATGAMPR